MGRMRQELKTLTSLALRFIVPSCAFSIYAISFEALVDGGVTYAELFSKLGNGFLLLDVEPNHFLGFVFSPLDVLIYYDAASF